ncbi:hypothetical protein CgunFtcFv8_002456 [Champsocephalus gunnari]|uniref:Uncharacterized protein n=1 Tax=Champsocephalus gunnari TaxID=52237 RepID=A0AAN8D8Q4_CHAGU|nr:hypothetical protein CgunFtcFv8_002456 [Champsocephalus gunnari]
MDRLETKWRSELSSILDELTEEHFRKPVSNLEEIPQGLKEGRLRGDMINLIIQYYGTVESIPLIDRQMRILPRKDNRVQKWLRDIKKELKTFQEQDQGRRDENDMR